MPDSAPVTQPPQPMGTTDLAAWLRAELDRREQIARRAEGTWEGVADGWRINIVDERGRTVAHLPLRLTADTPEDGDYATATLIEDHDPAAVLRRVAADRKILDQHAEAKRVILTYADPNDATFVGAELVTLGRTVRLLAAGYGWTDPRPCGATAVFWPDDEACDATCDLPRSHDGTRHHDPILGDWDEDELNTHKPSEA